jgi:hypothetical protein
MVATAVDMCLSTTSLSSLSSDTEFPGDAGELIELPEDPYT